MKPNDTSKKLPVNFPRNPEAIAAAIAAAPDGDDEAAVELDWHDAVPVHGGGVEAVRAAHADRRVRGPNKVPKKVQVSVRVKPEVIDSWKATGDGWQTRMTDAMARYSPCVEPPSIWHEPLLAFAKGRRDFKPEALKTMMQIGLLQFGLNGAVEVSPYGMQELKKAG